MTIDYLQAWYSGSINNAASVTKGSPLVSSLLCHHSRLLCVSHHVVNLPGKAISNSRFWWHEPCKNNLC